MWLLSVTDWGTLSVKLRPSQQQKPNERNGTMTKKIGAMDLKPGNLVLVKADAFQGKRKIKDRWEDKPHMVVCQTATDIPSYEVKDQFGQSHILHHSWLLLFTSETGIPLLWVSTKHGTDIQAPSHSSPLVGEVTARLHHEKIVVWWSPNARLGRLPQGGSMWSCDFSCGHPLEHPLRMGEDFR